MENFTTYTEEDPNTRITVTASRVTHTDLDRNETAYVALDKTADFFSGNFAHNLTVYMTALSNGSLVWAWGLANTLDDLTSIQKASGDFLGLGLVGSGAGVTPSITMSECDAGTARSDSYTPASLATPYYLRIVRSEGVGTYGTLYCYIYSDADRATTPLDTLTLTLHTSKKDFRYIYVVSSSNFPDTPITGSGYTENLTLLEGSSPTVTTQAVTDIAITTATGNGTITSVGSAAITQYGHCWNTSTNPTTANDKTSKGTGSVGTFISSMTGLTANTLYYVRAYATNTFGTSYGANVTFTTSPTGAPVVTTEICTDIASTTATGNGTITDIGDSVVTQHGHCWDTTTNPTTTDSSSGYWGKTQNGLGFYGTFTSAMTSLTQATGYYVRAYATNTGGTSYGGNFYFVAGAPAGSSERSGVIAVVQERIHYTGASGQEYYIQGTEV